MPWPKREVRDSAKKAALASEERGLEAAKKAILVQVPFLRNSNELCLLNSSRQPVRLVPGLPELKALLVLVLIPRHLKNPERGVLAEASLWDPFKYQTGHLGNLAGYLTPLAQDGFIGLIFPVEGWTEAGGVAAIDVDGVFTGTADPVTGELRYAPYPGV